MQIKSFLSIAAVALVQTSCSTTWGYKTRMGDKVYPPVTPEHVQIFFAAPNRPYEQIGIASF